MTGTDSRVHTYNLVTMLHGLTGLQYPDSPTIGEEQVNIFKVPQTVPTVPGAE